MSAMSCNLSDWVTPPELINKIRQALGGNIDLDAASSKRANEVIRAQRFISKEEDALVKSTSWDPIHDRSSLFLNPPGSRDGKLIRAFWGRWNVESWKHYRSCWLDFNLDHLRFVDHGWLVIPKQRIRYLHPTTLLPGNAPTIGSFMLFRGQANLAPFDNDNFTVGTLG